MTSDAIGDLRTRMEAAAAAMDFEEARRLRDAINLVRGGATVQEALSSDTSGLNRQAPGAMGLGSSRQQVRPPENWKRPAKPDPMTGDQKRGR